MAAISCTLSLLKSWIQGRLFVAVLKWRNSTKIETMSQFSFVLTIVVLLALQSVAFKPISPRTFRTLRKTSLLMAFDWKTAKKTSEEKMTKSVESLQSQLNTLRTSGANPNILDRIIVDCFDSTAPLNQVARVSASGSMQLVVEPFDKAFIKEIEKAIMCSNLNLNPNSDGDVIRINLPPLTEDRRKDFVKQAGAVCESSKVAIRNIRRDCVDKIKQAEKVKDIGKDESKGYQDDLQKSTDNFIKKMDTILKTKEADLLKI